MKNIDDLNDFQRLIIACLVDIFTKKHSVTQAARLYNVSRQSIYNWISLSGIDIEIWRNINDIGVIRDNDWESIREVLHKELIKNNGPKEIINSIPIKKGETCNTAKNVVKN